MGKYMEAESRLGVGQGLGGEGREHAEAGGW